MIRLSNPEALDPAILDRPGAFVWWYADLLDEAGNGLVLIWSFGLPFLPGSAPTPRDRPSINLALYKAGRPWLYLFQACKGRWDGESWSFDASQFRCSYGEERWSLDVRLDCAIPGTADRLQGTVRLSGIRRLHVEDAGDLASTHLWGPVSGPSLGEAELSIGSQGFRLSGRAYHDCNQSDVSLGALGIRSWTWGRAALPDEDRVWYLVEPWDGGAPLVLAFSVGADGTCVLARDLEVEPSSWRRSCYGPRWPGRLELRQGGQPWLCVESADPVENGPFYLRFLGRCDGGAPCFQELVLPDAIDIPWQRPFVRMRVYELEGPNSPLVAWFTGAREGRLGRVLHHWMGRV